MSNDSWRPKLHLAPQNGSISDPNGLNQFRGTYHICCQNAPEYPGNFDSPHGWGHFVSRDLVNWVFLGCQVMPDSPSDKDGSYSGGAYIPQDKSEVWYYYTGNVREPEGDGTYAGRLANQTRMRSYNGINMGPKEVVLDNSGYPAYCSCHVRDPKVWYQDGKMHMMLGARTRADSRGSVIMYDSDDGVSWTMSGSVTNLAEEPFGYMWECPDRIVLEGKEFLSTCPQGMTLSGEPDDPTRTTCQNVHAAGYFPIDGKILDLMRQDTGLMDADAPHPGIDQATFVDWDYGFDFYACQTLAAEDGRTMLVGWMSLPHDKNDVRPYDNPTSTWRGALTVPRVLTLSPTTGRILQNPPAEIDALRGTATDFAGEGGKRSLTVSPKVADVVISGIEGDGVVRFDDFLELRIADGIATLEFTDDAVGQGRKFRKAVSGDVRDVRVLVDTSVLEIYLNGGETVFGTRYFAETDAVTVSAEFDEIGSAVAYEMAPITINYVVDR